MLKLLKLLLSPSLPFSLTLISFRDGFNQDRRDDSNLDIGERDRDDDDLPSAFVNLPAGDSCFELVLFTQPEPLFHVILGDIVLFVVIQLGFPVVLHH